MADLVIDPTRVSPVEANLALQITAPAGEPILAGQIVRLDPTSGRLVRAGGTSAATAGNRRWMSIESAIVTGSTITAVRGALVDIGDVMDALPYDAPVYLSNTVGATADAAGTTNVQIGTVEPGWGTNPPDKLLRLSQ